MRATRSSSQGKRRRKHLWIERKQKKPAAGRHGFGSVFRRRRHPDTCQLLLFIFIFYRNFVRFLRARTHTHLLLSPAVQSHDGRSAATVVWKRNKNCAINPRFYSIFPTRKPSRRRAFGSISTLDRVRRVGEGRRRRCRTLDDDRSLSRVPVRISPIVVAQRVGDNTHERCYISRDALHTVCAVTRHVHRNMLSSCTREQTTCPHRNACFLERGARSFSRVLTTKFVETRHVIMPICAVTHRRQLGRGRRNLKAIDIW